MFFLGTKYSKPMGVTFLDAGGKEEPAEMGCYGIGVTRIVAAAIEQNHDKDGIMWPVPLAPYEVAVLDLQQDDPNVRRDGDADLRRADDAGIEVLYDDRDERAGREVQGRRPDRPAVPDRRRQEGSSPRGSSS